MLINVQGLDKIIRTLVKFLQPSVQLHFVLEWNRATS